MKFRPFVSDFSKRKRNWMNSSDPALTISTIRNSWTVIPWLFQRLVIHRPPFHSRGNVSRLFADRTVPEQLGNLINVWDIRRTGSVASWRVSTSNKAPGNKSKPIVNLIWTLFYCFVITLKYNLIHSISLKIRQTILWYLDFSIRSVETAAHRPQQIDNLAVFRIFRGELYLDMSIKILF